MIKNNYDTIDLELSRTYFGAKRAKKNDPEKDARQERIKKSYWYVGFTLYVIVFMASLVAVLYFGFLRVKPAAQIDPDTAPESLARMINIMQKQTSADEAAETPKYVPPPMRLLYDYEGTRDGWEIPAWAFEKSDHKALEVKQSKDIASHGEGSLRLMVDFPGGAWNAALVEIAHFLDLEAYDMISADISVPNTCPRGLKAKFILTLGEDWRFTEMSHNVPLSPGKWTTITADLTGESFDWKRTTLSTVDKQDVRKIAIRFESNMRPIYTGPIYIDNVRVWKKEADAKNTNPETTPLPRKASQKTFGS